ncbi:hypothetical protein SEMRO_3803_G351210.1 [Seminavis robusta]|uniref:Uncharacterized protein n=1 Tax=Seminavis robusta TaxID=568900 RepID=A0A9N8F2U1_9STRA|nr:hypothetical protein SEMRO_3803_G351210.1 [Seminavis robusta]|eukprot:Sro3803_g351210.1 n/a (252) ;mRNA; f:3487-4328
MSLKDDRAYATDDDGTDGKAPVMNQTKGFFIPTPKYTKGNSKEKSKENDGKRKFSDAFGGGFFSDVVWNSVGLSNKKKSKPTQVTESSNHSWKNNADKNTSKSKKNPVVPRKNSTIKIAPPSSSPSSNDSSDDEVEIVAPPPNYKRKETSVLLDCKDPKKTTRVKQALLEPDSESDDSDDSIDSTSNAIFNAPPRNGRTRRISTKAETIRKTTQVAIPGTAWRSMLDAHTGTSMELGPSEGDFQRSHQWSL